MRTFFQERTCLGRLAILVTLLIMMLMACIILATLLPTPVRVSELAKATANSMGTPINPTSITESRLQTPSPTTLQPTPTVTPTPPTDGFVTATALNVRAGPGVNYDRIGHLVADDPVTVKGTSADRSWLQIVSGDLEGWVSAAFIELTISLDGIPVSDTLFPTPSPTTTEPTPTIESTVESPETAEEMAYSLAVLAIEQSYYDSMEAFTELASEVQANPLLVFDGDWKTTVATQIAIVNNTGEQVRALTAPLRYERVQAHLVQTSLHFDHAGQLVAEAIDELDVSKIQQANDEVLLGQQEAEKAAAEFEKLQ